MPWEINLQLPKLTPLQARFAATIIASLILVLIFLYLSPVHFAYASELDSILKEDHNHHRLIDELLAETGNDKRLQIGLNQEIKDTVYQPDFIGIDRGIIGRQENSANELSNNVVKRADLVGETTQHYVFTRASLFGEPGQRGQSFGRSRNLRTKREDATFSGLGKRDEKMVYISISVCSQPTSSDKESIPPQLALYVSTSEDNQKPGPHTIKRAQKFSFVEGVVSYQDSASGDVFVGIASEKLGESFTGGWSYEIVASIDEPYFSFNEDSTVERFVNYLDSDSNSALLMTGNLINGDERTEEDQRLMESEPPYDLFAFPVEDINIRGLSNSFCALRNLSKSSVDIKVKPSMTSRGPENRAKEQFYVEGLKSTTSYLAYLAPRDKPSLESRQENQGGILGGGGQILQIAQFTTKAESNCQMVFDLSFCSDVAYAVPANADRKNATELIRFYDDYARDAYKNFSQSLQQIACTTTNTAQYSLVKTCDDCASDYKNWLCAVAIPRCVDFSAPDEFLQARNVARPFRNGSMIDDNSEFRNLTSQQRLYANSSRSPRIDEEIQPGPYKELLPCDEMCFAIVKSCPAKLGFNCPTGLEMKRSYGSKSDLVNGIPNDVLTCNLVGRSYDKSRASILRVEWTTAFSVTGLSMFTVMTLF